jgi:hypothetical protein
MLNPIDIENIVKSRQTANILVHDLSELVKSSNPLLAVIVIDILEQAALIEQRLKQIESITMTSTENIA